MNLSYGFLIRVREKLARPKVLLLEIFSISVALYFVMVFLCKVEETNNKLTYYQGDFSKDAMVYQINGEGVTDLEGDYDLKVGFNDYVEIEGSRSQERINLITKGFNNYYPNSISKEKWEKFFETSDKAIISKNNYRFF